MIVLPFAMHMANELLSVPVAGATLALAAGAVALAGVRARSTLDAEKLPLMGVMGAFVFAAQMINFALPGMPGTSGHLGGGVLLAILLGPSGAIVCMTAILIVQCLLFQDGGLLALGCNVLNMGVVPALAGWSAYRGILGRSAAPKPWRQYIAAWAAATVGVTAGAGLVPIQAVLSGVLRIPVADFLAVMVGVHLLIAFIEGAITFAVLAYLRRTRPATMGLPVADGRERLSRKAVLASLLLTATLLAGVISWFASARPDGLEWSYKHRAYGASKESVQNPSPTVRGVDAWQVRYALLPDYSRRAAALGQEPPQEPAHGDGAPEGRNQPEAEAYPNVNAWGSLAGLLGTAATLGLVYLLATLIRRRKTPDASS